MGLNGFVEEMEDCALDYQQRRAHAKSLIGQPHQWWKLVVSSGRER